MGETREHKRRFGRSARWRPHSHAHSGIPKVRYTQAEARAKAQELRDEDLYNGMAFRRWPTAYPCSDPECGGWHVGNWNEQARPTESRNDG